MGGAILSTREEDAGQKKPLQRADHLREFDPVERKTRHRQQDTGGGESSPECRSFRQLDQTCLPRWALRFRGAKHFDPRAHRNSFATPAVKLFVRLTTGRNRPSSKSN